MKYSIITPVYNRADCVARCLDSVIRNLSENIIVEHLVVDDGSTDETPTILSKYASEYSHIKYIHLPINKGTNAARNAAIKASTGDFCIILDSDDYFVDNAIEIINQVIEKNKFKHYMFAADDMLGKYDSNPLLNKGLQTVLYFEDFLAERVCGDFIHVISSDIMKRHLFEEKIRIYEFINFLNYYKDSQKILFTNKVVTHRERNRNDSVTKEVIRNSKRVINTRYFVAKTVIDNFFYDFQKAGLDFIISQYIQELIENSLLLSNYSQVKQYVFSRWNSNSKKAFIYRFIYFFKLGWLFRWLLFVYLYFKYNVFKKRIE